MIYLVRHGQTEFNAVSRWQGQVDSPLTSLGRQQAERVGLTLRGIVDPATTTIFASPLGRVRQTADIIAKATGISHDIQFDPRLMEISMGSWDGMTDYEIDMEWPNARIGLDRFEWFFHAPDGENYGAFAKRLSEALDALATHPAETKVIVSHGVAGRVLRGLYGGFDRAEALRLDVPQDAFFRLASGRISRIDCA